MLKATNSTKIKMILFAVIILFMALIGSGKLQQMIRKQEKVITIGVFSDSYWDVQNGYSYRIVDDAIKVFEKEHPGYRVEYVSGIMKDDYGEWLAECLMQGTEPDLFFILGDEFNNLSQMGALKDLSSLIEKDDSFDSAGFYQSAYEYGENQGVQYALPFECAPKLMLVNESILKAEGLELPGQDWHWSDFYDICSKVTKDLDGNGTPDQFGVVGYSWEDAFYTNGIQIFNEEGTKCNLQGEEVLEALSYLEKLNALNQKQTVTERDFNLGKVAFMPMLFSEYRAYKSYPLSVKKYSGFEWGCTTMPAGEDGQNLSVLDTLMIGMSNRTAYEEEAWDLMKILTTDQEIQSEIFVYSEGISVQKSVTESDEADIYMGEGGMESSPMSREILSKVMEEAIVIPRFDGYDEAVKKVGDSVDEIISGDKNIEMELIIQNRAINHYLQEK